MQIEIEVRAEIPWTDTGVPVEKGKQIRIKHVGGTWTCNPASSPAPYGANGIAGLVAKPGYVVPGANEGGLVGKVGEQAFWIGPDGVVPEIGPGNLLLGINEDQQGEYGRSYADNQGALIVRIAVIGGRPLTLEEVQALRLAAHLNKPASGKDQAPSDGGSSEHEAPQRDLPPGKRPRDPDSDDEPPGKRRKLPSTRRAFTMLIWNVANYGENKTDGNPIANQVIRMVLDELAVDLAMFLETQTSASMVAKAIEHSIANPMRTQRERQTGRGTDITFKVRWLDRELAELEAEAEQAHDPDHMQAQAELPFVFVPVGSGSTGKVKVLPPKIGTYRSWPRGTSRGDKAADIARFKSIYSYEGSRPTPVWIYHIADLYPLYDLRLRKVDPGDGNLPIGVDEQDLTRPLTAGEIAALVRGAELQSIDKNELDYMAQVREGQRAYESMQPAERKAYIQQVLNALRNSGVVYDEKKIRDSFEIQPPRFTDQDLETMRDELNDRDERTQRRGRLAQLERAVVFTLRTQHSGACGTQPRAAPLPPRDVIGIRNEGNACYLSAALQLILRIGGVDGYVLEGERTDAELADAVTVYVRDLAEQAANGRYATREGALPPRQLAAETNFKEAPRTEALRDMLRVRCGWATIYDPEDAQEALNCMFNALDRKRPAQQVAPRYLLEVRDQPRALDEARFSQLQFYLAIDTTYNVRNLGPELPSSDNDLVLGPDGLHTRVEGTNLLQVALPADGAPTLAELLQARWDRGPGPGESETSRCAWNGKSYQLPRLREQTAFVGGPPQRMLVALNRFELRRSGSRSQDPQGERDRREARPQRDEPGAGNVLRVKIDTKVREATEMAIGDRRYRLKGLIEHRGSAYDGHYVAWILRHGRWYEINDDHVTPRTQRDVEQAAEAGYIFYFDSSDDAPDAPDREPPRNDPTTTTTTATTTTTTGNGGPGPGDALMCDVYDAIVNGITAPPQLALPPRRCTACATPETLAEVHGHLAEMIGTRHTEAYIALFRGDPASIRRPIDPVQWVGGRDVVMYAFKSGLLSTGVNGIDLGYQDPTRSFNGRCPFYLQIEIIDQSQRWAPVPVVFYHTPYTGETDPGRPRPSPRRDDSDQVPALPGKQPGWSEPTRPEDLQMRSDAIRALLELGVPDLSGGGDGRRQRLGDFPNAVIAADFNLDYLARGESPQVEQAYAALEGAGFQPANPDTRSVVASVESVLPANQDPADPEDRWYTRAYDNIFVTGSDLHPARTDGTAPRVVGGVLDVLDLIVRRRAEIISDGDLDDLIDTAANYRPTVSYTPRQRAHIERARWDRATPRERALFIYRKYVSDHLPVFVDVVIDPQDAPPTGPDVPSLPTTGPARPLIGIQNGGSNTCYLNASLQLLAAIPIDRNYRLAENSPMNQPDLATMVDDFVVRLREEAASGTYAGDRASTGPTQASWASWVSWTNAAIRGQLQQLRPGRFAFGRQEDAGEALTLLLDAHNRPLEQRNERDEVIRQGPRIDSPYLVGELRAQRAIDQNRLSALHFFMVTTETYDVASGRPSTSTAPLVLDGNGVYTKVDCRNVLELPILDKVDTLQGLWNAYRDRRSPEGEDERSVCQYNGVTLAYRRTREQCEIPAPPDRLIVLLTRFRVIDLGPQPPQQPRGSTGYDRQNGRYQRIKLTNQVVVDTLTIGDTRYQLRAFICHLGYSADAGHYIAYRRLDDTWYRLNDTTVTRDPADLTEARDHGYIYYFERA